MAARSAAVVSSAQGRVAVGQPSVRSLRRGIAILRVLNAHGPLSVVDVADRAGMPRITSYRILLTLVDEGLVERIDGTGLYRLTAAVCALSAGFSPRDQIAAAAAPVMAATCRELGWPLVLAANSGPRMVIRVTTRHLTSFDVQEQGVGGDFPLLRSAAGLAFVAHCDSTLRQDLLAAALRDPEARGARLSGIPLDQELAKIRAQRYVYVPVSWTSHGVNLSAVGVPLFVDGELRAALSIAFYQAAVPRSTALSRFVTPLQRTADAISRQFGMPTAPH